MIRRGGKAAGLLDASRDTIWRAARAAYDDVQSSGKTLETDWIFLSFYASCASGAGAGRRRVAIGTRAPATITMPPITSIGSR